MNDLKQEIENLFLEYDKLYIPELTESAKILEYGENEFFGGKREAYEEALELIKKYSK